MAIAYKSYPQIADIARRLQSRDLMFNGRRITQMRPAGTEKVELVDSEGKSTFHDKITLDSASFKDT